MLVVWAALTLMAAAGLIVGGCAPRLAGGRGTFAAPSNSVAPLDPIISPSALGEPVGFELRWWAMRNIPDEIDRVIGPYRAQPAPVDGATAERLRKAGLRIVAIPMAELLNVRSRLPIVGRIDRRWIGLSPTWVEGMAGQRFVDGRTIAIDGEVIRLRAGKLRLAVRTWSEPTLDGMTLRLDLAVQHVDVEHFAGTRSALDDPDSRPTMMNEGQVFRTTLAQFAVDGGSFYLVFADDPDRLSQPAKQEKQSDTVGVDEAARPASDEKAEAKEPVEPNEWTPAPVVDAAQVNGPRSARLPTLGEALLTPPAEPDGRRAWRAVVAIVPRMGADAKLLP